MGELLRIAVLSLPVQIDDPEAASLAVATELSNRGIEDETQQEEWLYDALDTWRDDPSSPGLILKSVVRSAVLGGLAIENQQTLDRLAKGLPTILEDLAVSQRLGWSGATAVLKRVGLIVRLATTDQASSARIAQALGSDGSDFPTSWRPIQKLLQHLRLKPTVDVDAFVEVAEADAELYTERFPDSDEIESAAAVDRVATRLGVEPGLTARLLRELFSVPAAQDGIQTVWPYVQMLHHQCIICEHVDHPLTLVYEFNPRSAKKDPFWAYYDHVVDTLNPFLNNAKAVDLLDANWARNATSRHIADLPRMMALVELLQVLDRLAWNSRRALASWLRTWCHQMIDLSQQPANPIDVDLLATGIATVVAELMNGSTGTKGVIEQRFVDACALTIHDDPDVVLRGLGSPVEEPNLPRRRLGDVDAQNTNNRTVVAYEPTAGQLKTSYLHLHARTLRRSLARRLEREWAAIEPDPTAWTVRVRFVASNVDAVDATVTEDYNGVQVDFEVLTFKDLLDEAIGAGGLEQHYSTWVHGVLNERRTRRRYREAYAALLP